MSPGSNSSALEASRRDISEDVLFGISTGTLFGCRAIELGKTFPRGVWYTQQSRRIRHSGSVCTPVPVEYLRIFYIEV